MARSDKPNPYETPLAPKREPATTTDPDDIDTQIDGWLESLREESYSPEYPEPPILKPIMIALVTIGAAAFIYGITSLILCNPVTP